MTAISNFAERAFAAVGAMAMTAILLTSYFATPQTQAVAGLIA